MRRTIAVLAVAGLALLGVACSDDEADDSAGTTERSESTAGDSGDQDLRAAATDTVVAYFTARATNEFDDAREVSGGAAELVIDWNEAVGGVDAAATTPYAVQATAAPDVRVEIGDLVEEDGRWLADGFIELSIRPAGEVPASTTTPPTTEGQAPPGPVTNVFVTDLTFERSGDALELVDYRYDDVPYPVSELYLDAAAAGTDVEGVPEEAGEEAGEEAEDPAADDADTAEEATEEAAEEVAEEATSTTMAGGAGTDDTMPAGTEQASVRYGRRSMDGSVQWIVEHPEDQRMATATLFPDTDPAGGTPPAEGIDLDVFDDGDDGVALVVWAGGFPGSAGTMEATLEPLAAGGGPATSSTSEDTDEATEVPERTAMVDVPPFPELGAPRPLNAVRDQEAEATSTTTSTTEPEEDEESTTTSEPDEVTVPPVTGPSTSPSTTLPDTPSTTSSSTTSSSTTSTTAAG